MTRAVAIALAVYAMLLQTLLPLSVARAETAGPVAICSVAGSFAAPGKAGVPAAGHDCLACCLTYVAAGSPPSAATPRPLALAAIDLGPVTGNAGHQPLPPGDGWPPAPRSPPVFES
jgi:hypothetical protein